MGNLNLINDTIVIVENLKGKTTWET